ncbi:hypothetical protein Tco_1491532 [Tanacetum coccineum]
MDRRGTFRATELRPSREKRRRKDNKCERLFMGVNQFVKKGHSNILRLVVLPLGIYARDPPLKEKNIEREKEKKEENNTVKLKGIKNERRSERKYVGPFKVLEKDGEVAYKLELPEELSRVHNTFHVSNLKKCHADEPLAVPLDGLHLDDNLHFVEEPL